MNKTLPEKNTSPFCPGQDASQDEALVQSGVTHLTGDGARLYTGSSRCLAQGFLFFQR